MIPTTLLAITRSRISIEKMTRPLEWMKTVLRDVQDSLSRAQVRMKQDVDQKRRSEVHKLDDEVVSTSANLQTYGPHLLRRSRHSGLNMFPSFVRYCQIQLDWICLQVGESTPSSILATSNAISSCWDSYRRSIHQDYDVNGARTTSDETVERKYDHGRLPDKTNAHILVSIKGKEWKRGKQKIWRKNEINKARKKGGLI